MKVLRSEQPYRGKVLNVRVDEVEVAPGQVMRVDIVEHADAVTVVPLDNQGRVWFVRQYRHPAGESLLELPAGVLDEGEDPAAAANRELQEEIGQRAEKLEPLGRFYLAPGYSTEQMHVFLATGLSESRLQHDADEDIQLELVPAAEALARARHGAIKDAKTIAALFLAESWLLPKAIVGARLRRRANRRE